MLIVLYLTIILNMFHFIQKIAFHSFFMKLKRFPKFSDRFLSFKHETVDKVWHVSKKKLLKKIQTIVYVIVRSVNDRTNIVSNFIWKKNLSFFNFFNFFNFFLKKWVKIKLSLDTGTVAVWFTQSDWFWNIWGLLKLTFHLNIRFT